jgi:ABC-type molybdate transport system substrate-binding protein
MPPPKAMSRELRSPPAAAIWRSSFSTERMVLCASPGDKNSTTVLWKTT